VAIISSGGGDPPCISSGIVSKDAPKKIALAKTAMPVLREGGMIGDIAVQPEPTKPSVRQIEVGLLTEASLGADTETVTDDQHADHQLGIDRRRPIEL
jgi:hypothetical protein